jgi:hypothetical protein
MTKKESGSKGGKDDVSYTVQATPKWTVLEAPGVSQPDWNASVEAEAVEADVSKSSNSKKTADASAQGRRLQAGDGQKMESSRLGGDSFVHRSPKPSWLSTRNTLYQKIQDRRRQEAASQKPVPIRITLPDGKVLEQDTASQQPFLSYQTTPYQVAVTISQGLADAATVARVQYATFCPDYSLELDGMAAGDTLLMEDNGNEDSPDSDDASTAEQQTFLWDMTRPLVGDVAKLEFLKFETDQNAKTVFWHSSAHMMGEALEHLYGCKLTIGPPLAGGFYYDSYMGTDALKEDDCEYGLVYNLFRVSSEADMRLFCFVVEPQTHPWRPKLPRLSKKSRRSSVWSLPRKKDWSCLPTILSRSTSSRPRLPMARVRPFTDAET